MPRVTGYVQEIVKSGHNVIIISPSVSRKKKKYLKKILGDKIQYTNSISTREKKHVVFFLMYLLRKSLRYKQVNRVLLLIHQKLEINNEIKLEILAKKVMKSGKIDVVISTSSPFYCHKIAHNVKKHNRLKWFADYRDLWSLNHVQKKTEEAILELESQIISIADGVITVANHLRDQMAMVYKGDIYLLRNGFESYSPQQTSILSRVVNIDYFGQIYFDFHDVNSLILNIEKLNNDPNNSKKYVLRFFGMSSKQIGKYCREMYKTVPAFIESKGVLMPEQVSLLQNKSDFLLIFNWMDNSFSGALPTKLYEYISHKAPILAVGARDSDECSHILQETGLGIQLRDDQDFQLWNRKVQDLKEFPLVTSETAIMKYSYANQLDHLIMRLNCK